MNPISPIVLHIPHSSRNIPVDIKKFILLSNSDLEIELTKMTDAHTDELFVPACTDVQTVVFPVSRLVVDPERFLNDDQEIMASLGMGAIYTRSSNGQPLRHQPNRKTREALIERYYRSHHLKFEASVTACLQRFGHCIIIDCHSFPSKPLPYELDQDPYRPDICIGTDTFHTPDLLAQEVAKDFEGMGFNVAINRPFAGAIAPLKYYQKESGVKSIMIELNRKLYMDEKIGKKNNRFNSLKGNLADVLQRIEVFSHR